MIKRFGLVLLAALVCGQGTAYAVPVLQLYIEGGVYDEATRTWVLAPTGVDGRSAFRLWAIGNVDGPGGRGAITDVRLAVAYGEGDLGLTFSLVPARLDPKSFPGFTDLPILGVPRRNTTVRTSLGLVITGPDGVVVNGGAPQFGNGRKLPLHDVFGPGTVWQEFSLGDFDSTASPIGDFVGSLPSFLKADAGQIKVYDVSVIGGHGAKLHFDLYGMVHDLQGPVAVSSAEVNLELILAPEPAPIIVWLVIGLTWAGSAWMYQFLRRWQQWGQEELLAVATLGSPDQAGPFADRAEEVDQQASPHAGIAVIPWTADWP